MAEQPDHDDYPNDRAKNHTANLHPWRHIVHEKAHHRCHTGWEW